MTTVSLTADQAAALASMIRSPEVRYKGPSGRRARSVMALIDNGNHAALEIGDDDRAWLLELARSIGRPFEIEALVGPLFDALEMDAP